MKRIIFILVLVGFVSFYFFTNDRESANDYYEYINEKFLSDNHIEEDKYVYNTFSVAQEESNEGRDTIVKEIVSGSRVIDSSNKIKTLYNNVIDWGSRNRLSISPLKSYIDKVMNSKNIDEVIENIVVLENDLGIDIFTRISVDKDFKDNSKNIVYLYPVTFAFGSSVDYFSNDDYMAYKAYIKRGIINLLEMYGMSLSEARFVSNEVISFYTDISSKSQLSSTYEDVSSYYNMVDSNYLESVYTKFDMVKYLEKRGLKEKKYSLVDEEQYREINKYLTDEYLMLWKKVILVKILSSYASYLDEGYRNIVLELNNSLTGASDTIDIEEEAINLVSNVFSSDIDIMYDEKVITDNDKKYLNELFLDIKKYFRKMLKKNTWLSDDTKKYATLKLDNMKVYIGDDGVSYSDKIEVSGNNLVENIISINKSSYLISLDKLNNNKDTHEMSQIEVNAYYNPIDNAVYIPSSVVFLLKNSDSYYERLGTIGMVIAHEITHGFDYNGSKFDSKGNFNNWWNDKDRKNYTKLKDGIVSYYNNIEVIDGKYIDGDLTVNENIADMGAVKVITGVAKERGASSDDLKVMYSSFADFWKCQVTDEYAKLLLLNDSHSPNKYRVNAVLSLINEFYDVYKVYPWNDMYVSKGNRLSVW